jgi:uncharacterized protein
MSKESTSSTAVVLEEYLDALRSGDLERIRKSFAPDATWQIHGSLPLAGTYAGADASMNFLETAMGELFVPGTQEFAFGPVLAVGETALLEWNVTGTGSATNRRYDNDYCGIFVVYDGRIRAVRE